MLTLFFRRYNLQPDPHGLCNHIYIYIYAYLMFLRYNPQPDPHGLCNHFMSKRENVRLIKSLA